ncbi:MAG: cupin domain-containing protein [Nitrosomonas sp.]|jgi:cupin 2 domain-containing protein|nr:cupin domain-containing protein [Nitrosomonas sp.]
MKSQNVFENIPCNIEHELFEFLIKSNTVKIERIISKGHKSPKSAWYDQEENEWIMILKGSAELLFENQVSVQLGEGDYINIPSHKKHKVSWTDPESETIWLAVHY